MDLVNVALNALVIAVATAWLTWHARGRFNDIGRRIQRVEMRQDRLEKTFDAWFARLDRLEKTLEAR